MLIISFTQVKDLNLSFHTAKDLCSRAKILPPGPEWKCKPCTTVHPTKNKIDLFYRDPIECLQSLMHSPLVKESINFDPIHVFTTAAKLMRVYTEWLSGDTAWSMQVCDVDKLLLSISHILGCRLNYRLALPFLVQFSHPIRQIFLQ